MVCYAPMMMVLVTWMETLMRWGWS
ncbi:hypothetical protein Pint_22530 [Pistacia integerrima]|uniref:Uncharacterized protein n=1 Tax=Pistacia integerrima TaxID=434235 RepID=A0ACC0YI57_9ROSI|nr:hypothetical protein Pint_22530 [Pistacia integerrima]